MSEHNPYDAPQAPIVEIRPEALPSPLAGRLERLLAAIIDGVILLAILMPAMYVGGYFAAVMDATNRGEKVSFLLMVLWSVIGFVCYAVVQGYPLHRTAQTWGKRLLGIRIVDMDGRQPPLTVLLLRRVLPLHLVGLVPFVGAFVQFIDPLLIFRDDRRCIHDHIAGTQVVRHMTPEATAAELRP